jgi:hypothetical protein
MECHIELCFFAARFTIENELRLNCGNLQFRMKKHLDRMNVVQKQNNGYLPIFNNIIGINA